MSTEPSTEPLAGETAGALDPGARCGACNAPIASDQRYCLECGERLAPISAFLLGRRPDGTAEQPSAPPSAPPGVPPAPDAARAPRSNLLGVLAGVGVLLLAMGVGVLIGRAGNSKPAAAKEQVITQSAPAAGPGAAATEGTFTSDWPASRSGYTVQLSTLPTSSTVAAVQAAKTTATAKGAPAVGALDSGDFASLPSGGYVIYSGVFRTGAQAQKALARLRGKFPGSKVIHVSGGGSGAGGAGGGSSSGAGGSSGGSSHVHSSLSHPAPPSVLKSLKGKGKSYVEASKNLPDVVETG
ncbi:MAG TPA: hypothetical protein VLZ06_01930 [Solirubrobacteraceae bacterium]|nr:hypothetical protein [Solirubrobacteraceae bacterium]